MLFQILFDITEDDEPMMQLIQKSNRKPNEERMTIGFTILKVNPKFEPSVLSLRPVER